MCWVKSRNEQINRISKKDTGYIDYDALETSALEFKPKLIICGASAYPRDIDYDKFRKVGYLSFVKCIPCVLNGNPSDRR